MTKKIVTLSESQLADLIKRAMNEANHRTENYMTFSNLQQMKRQIDMLMELDENVIDEIIQNGHDWADDHISVAKENLDQVFDFMMNETKKGKEYIDYEEMTEGRKKTGTKLCARGK